MNPETIMMWASATGIVETVPCWKPYLIGYYTGIYKTIKTSKPMTEFVRECLRKRISRIYRQKTKDPDFALDMNRWFWEALDRGLWEFNEIASFMKEKYFKEHSKIPHGVAVVISIILVIVGILTMPVILSLLL